jgi:hypothetical protein
MNGRAEAHALRLQVLYSILDETEYIDTPHVLASLAVVQYSEDTVRYVFSGSTGNKDADRILTKLSDIGPMSKSDIHIQCFGNNLLGERLDKALLLLEQGNYITHEEVVTNGNTTHVYDSV